MTIVSTRPRALILTALLAAAAPGSLAAQQTDAYQDGYQQAEDGEVMGTIYGTTPDDLSEFAKGPELEGLITARRDNKVQITTMDGSNTVILLSEGTVIKSRGGFLGLGRDTLGADQLLNGLPVSVETVEWNGGLVASRIDLKAKDLQTAAMIRSGTAQGFAEQTAATEALRGRVANIDQYNVKGTTNVTFDTGKAELSAQAKADLCAAAAQAQATDNALLLVVGYTDSTGSYEFNQELSEKRASRVVNHLQQECGWQPYRMLTPTGMAEADPVASNDTDYGKAQNRRVAVNILVSKSVDGL